MGTVRLIINGVQTILLVCLALATGSIPADARQIRVPAHYPTIQAAIDVSDHGDTILISSGTWTGPGNRDLDTAGKAIVIRSTHGPESCVIDCQEQGRGFHLHSCESHHTVIQGLTIRGGAANDGGGICGYWCGPTIIDCVITNCTAAAGGGGISGIYFSALLMDCRIENNQARDGGGLCLDQGSNARLVRCVISGNSTDRNGGGLFCHNGSAPILEDCSITGNVALFGGGIGIHDAQATIRGCEFIENQAWGGGGLFLSGPSEPLLLDSLFRLNKAQHGGAVYGGYGRFRMTNCLLLENSAFAGGGAIFCREVTAMVSSCTVSGNTVLEPRGGAVTSEASYLGIIDTILWGDHPRELLTTAGKHPLVTYSNIQGGYPGQGNMDVEPLFTTGPCGRYCLCQLAAGEAAQSPCVDAGSRAARQLSSAGAPPSQRPAGTINRSDWGVDTGRLDLGYHYRLNTILARLDCQPSFNWLPSTGWFTATLGNACVNQRRIAAQVDLTTAQGETYPAWRSGWLDVDPGKRTSWSWALDLPAHPGLAGTSTFHLSAEDVTPAPFNQPPCPPAGHRTEQRIMVIGAVPSR